MKTIDTTPTQQTKTDAQPAAETLKVSTRIKAGRGGAKPPAYE